MLINAVVPSSGKTIFRTAIGNMHTVTAAWFCNTSGDTKEKLNLYLVAKDGEIGPSSQIVCELEIQPMDTVSLDTERIVFEDGDSLYAESANGTVAAVLSAISLA